MFSCKQEAWANGSKKQNSWMKLIHLRMSICTTECKDYRVEKWNDQVCTADWPFMTYSFSCEPSLVIAVKRFVSSASVWAASSVLVTLQWQQNTTAWCTQHNLLLAIWRWFHQVEESRRTKCTQLPAQEQQTCTKTSTQWRRYMRSSGIHLSTCTHSLHCTTTTPTPGTENGRAGYSWPGQCSHQL